MATNDIQIRNDDGEFVSIFPLSRPGSNASWVNGRDHVVAKTNSCGSSQYCPVISAKSQNGSWEIGPYNNDTLHFSYITDTNYNAGTNTKTGGVEFSKDGKINAKALLNAYPVGALYISYVSTSPANLFGGSWSQITGRFLYCTTNTTPAGSNTHTLTASQLPKLGTQIWNFCGQSSGTALAIGTPSGYSGIGSHYGDSSMYYTSYRDSWSHTDGFRIAFGGGSAHNNMPAYQGVYCWRRTA